MRRNPIRDCEGKVPVDRKDRKVERGIEIAPDRNISLLTPVVVFKARERNEQDSLYAVTTARIIKDSVETRFIRDEWVDRIIPQNYDLDGLDAESIKSLILTYKQDTIEYKKWQAPQQFVTESSTDYSLLMVVDAIIGFEGAQVRERYFWTPEEIGAFRESELTGNHLMFFLIDNKSRKITFADHYVFHCDIRNPTSLQKVLDYAYLRLLGIRFRN